METLSIIISCIGVIISEIGVAISLLFLINVFELKKVKEDLLDIAESSCCLFSDDDIINGRDAVQQVMLEYHCDRITAMKIIHKKI